MYYLELNILPADGIIKFLMKRQDSLKRKDVDIMTDSEKLDLILNKVESVDTKMESMDTRMESLDTRIESLEDRIESIEDRMDSMETQLSDVKLTLENEIRKNIEIVAEGHLDLSRNLHEAMKPYNAMEMVQVQISILESKVRDLEKAVQVTA